MVVSGENKELADGSASACTNACTETPDSVQTDVALQHLITAWPDLPDAVKAGITAMVQATTR